MIDFVIHDVAITRASIVVAINNFLLKCRLDTESTKENND